MATLFLVLNYQTGELIEGVECDCAKTAWKYAYSALRSAAYKHSLLSFEPKPALRTAPTGAYFGLRAFMGVYGIREAQCS